MPRATGSGTQLARYEEAWEAINLLIRRGGSWSGHERKCFFVQSPRGTFENVSAVSGLDVPEDGRGLAVWDFDRDGDPDLILKSRNGPQLRIWRNDFPRRNARITVELEGVASNRQAVGARVKVTAGGQTRLKEVCAGSGFLSQNSHTLFFGLGGASGVDRIEVRWPSGRTQSFERLAVNRAYSLREGDAAPASRAFEPPSPRAAARLAEAAVPDRAKPSTAFWLIAPCLLPSLGLETLDGKRIDLGAQRAKPALLSLWSPDCPVCAGEMAAWSKERSPAVGPDLILASVTDAAREVAALAAARYGLETAFLPEKGRVALGILLEDMAHVPREVPTPTSLLLDERGSAVKLYRGPVAWSEVASDAAVIPSSPSARLAAALPFPGKYHATDLTRNEFQLGVNFLEADLLDHALLAFERSLERGPEQADALYNAGIVHQRRGEPELALQCFEAALEKQPDFADAIANHGVLLAQARRLDEAAEDFEAVLRLRPDHAEAMINLGNVELSRDRPADALRAYSRARALEPGMPHVLKKIGDACRRLGDGEGARRAYEEAVKLAPRDPEAWSNLAVILAEAGQLDDALALCEKALEVDPEYPSAHNNAGLILQGQGKVDLAIVRFRKAIDLAPAMAAPYLNLARAYLRQGDEDEARAVLKTLLASQPEHPAAREMLRKLKKR